MASDFAVNGKPDLAKKKSGTPDFVISGKYVILAGRALFGVSIKAAKYLDQKQLVLAPMYDPGYLPKKHVPILALITEAEFGSTRSTPPTWERLKQNDLLEAIRNVKNSIIKNHKGNTKEIAGVQLRVSHMADDIIAKADKKTEIDDLMLRDMGRQNGKPLFILGVSDDDDMLQYPKEIFCLNIIEETLDE